MIPRRQTKYLLYFMVIISGVCYSQKITALEIKGYNNFPEQEYLNWINGNELKFHSRQVQDTIKNKLASRLADHGYYNSEVDLEINNIDSSNSVLVINISENEPTYIDKIFYENLDSADSQAVSSIFSYSSGKIFNKLEFEEAINAALDYYENGGNPFASVVIKSLNFHSDSGGSESLVDIHLKFSKKQTSIIDKIKIKGNSKTRDYVIIRNSGISLGDRYSQEKLDRIPALLNRLNIFERVSEPVFYFNAENEGVLEITLTEKETNSFDGIVGYVPSNKSKSGFFTGFINLGLRNLFGTERSAFFRWQKEDRESQELEIRYREPWIFGFAVNIDAGLFQRKQDTLYVQRRVEGSIEFVAAEEISASFLVAAESTIPSDSDKFIVFNSSSIQTGAQLKIDTRNDIISPSSGLFFKNSYKYNSKKINGPKQFLAGSTNEDITLQLIELDFSYYFEIFNRQIISLEIHGKELIGSDFEISDLFKFGGTNTLRGYRENQFFGNRISWFNSEYRYLIERSTFAFLFFDMGYYLRKQNMQISFAEETMLGYGFGLKIESGLGIIGVSFALAGGDSFSEGKIHLGLLNEF
ncbi:MAG: BamA/TamA family outer membrane protein [Melioribacteraceae bacterium]|nr:BamA/TamA family outer membrane protein [Melioribacteraceae bacterium]